MSAPLKIYMAADHGGFELKNHLHDWLSEQNVDVVDLGTHTTESVDYPDIAYTLASALFADKLFVDKRALGILICGSGIGVSIAANRHPYIRAALVNEPVSATLARQHNDANVLCLSGRLIGYTMAKACVHAFLDASFEGGRHQGRVDKLTDVAALTA